MKKLFYAILLSFTLFLVSCSSNNEGSTTETQTDVGTETTENPLPENDTATIEEATPDIEDAPMVVASQISSKESFKNTSHNVTGEVSIFSDNTLNIENFSYDGKAPDVYVYLGYYEGNKFIPTHRISELLDRAYTGELFITSIPADIDFNSINAVSIWCDEFTEDMGSTSLTVN